MWSLSGAGYSGWKPRGALCDLGLHVTVLHLDLVLMNARSTASVANCFSARSKKWGSSSARARLPEQVIG